jgi:biopolymer transport protein TolR
VPQVENRGRGGRSRGPRMMAEINIIPLVDVMLVLLIIFMATTAFVKDAGFKMQLPAAKTGTASGNGDDKDLTILLTRDDQLLVDGKPTDEKSFLAQMQARVRQNPQVSVVIKGDQGIPYSRVVHVMDLARQAGLSSVSLGTRFPPSGEAAR